MLSAVVPALASELGRAAWLVPHSDEASCLLGQCELRMSELYVS